MNKLIIIVTQYNYVTAFSISLSVFLPAKPYDNRDQNEVLDPINDSLVNKNSTSPTCNINLYLLNSCILCMLYMYNR